jgi:hypothetical protein
MEILAGVSIVFIGLVVVNWRFHRAMRSMSKEERDKFEASMSEW